jgi:hypothetical protein
MDDPLRVLRLIRIGSKLGFALDTDAMWCMRDDEIRRALDTMIKRDRINIEVFKMMRDPDPVAAFQHLFDAKLYTPVFLRLDSPLVRALQAEYPVLGHAQGQGASHSWPASWPRAYRLLHHLLKSDSGSSSSSSNSNLHHMVQSESKQNVEHLWAMAAYAPLAPAHRQTPTLKQAVQEATAAIKLPAKLTKLLEAALANFDAIHTILDIVAQAVHSDVATPRPRPKRSTIGMALRAWGPTWRAQVVYVLLAEVVYDQQKGEEGSDDDEAVAGLAAGPVVKKYAAFADFVAAEGLWDAHTLRPCLDGNEVLKLLGLRAGGRFLKDVLDGLVAWQLDHPGAGVEEAKVWLGEERGRLGVPVQL